MQGRGTLFPSMVIAVSASVWGLYWVPLRLISEAGVGPAMSVAVFNLPALALTAVLFAVRFRQSSRPIESGRSRGLTRRSRPWLLRTRPDADWCGEGNNAVLPYPSLGQRCLRWQCCPSGPARAVGWR